MYSSDSERRDLPAYAMFGFGATEAIVLLMVVVLLVALPAGLVVLMALRAAGRTGSSSEHTEEAELLREIRDGLKEMDKRVEALETILMDRADSNRYSGTGRKD